MLPVASTSDESRYMNDRIDNLRKPGGSVAALKELYTVEGYNLVFQAQPSTDGSLGKEVCAQVPFEEVSDLVASRRVFLSKGYAYVAMSQTVEALSNAYFGPDYSQPKDAVEISLKDIDQLAKTSFPLCVRHMLDKLRENHHLKH